ncbi:hypothetical protein, partial [Bradyrhizobium sp.]|uniref:hypothetical protein n=1 Tax=Bradyrhizobium sp. TaxID=376 RepID=UPI00391B6034
MTKHPRRDENVTSDALLFRSERRLNHEARKTFIKANPGSRAACPVDHAGLDQGQQFSVAPQGRTECDPIRQRNKHLDDVTMGLRRQSAELDGRRQTVSEI